MAALPDYLRGIKGINLNLEYANTEGLILFHKTMVKLLCNFSLQQVLNQLL